MRNVRKRNYRKRRALRARRRLLAKPRRRGVKKTSSGGRRRLMGFNDLPLTNFASTSYGYSQGTASSGLRAAKRTAAAAGIGDDPQGGTGAYNQWSSRYAQAKFGRLSLKKLLGNLTDHTTFTWQRYGRFGDSGQIFLSNYKDTTAGSEDYTLPIVCMDLTSCLNYQNGTLTQYSPTWQLYKSFNATTAGRYQWVPLQGQTPAGINNTNWQLEYSSHRSNTQMAYPNAASILKFASIELELWGMKNHPTKYTIEVCRFDEEVCPTTDMSADGNYNEFWDSMTKQYAYSPLANNMSGFNKKKYSVLRRYNVDIDPTASFENDSDPHVKTFKIFLRFNRRMNYAWKYANAAGQTAQQYESSVYEQEDNENQCVVHPNARIFLLIRATNYNIQTVVGDITNANTPSFSIKCKTRHILGT